MPHNRNRLLRVATAQRRQQAYRFRRKDLEPFAFAGIWEFARLNGEEILSAAMIVGEPNPLVGGVHDRMPVMLLPEDYDAWLGSTTAPADLRSLLRPTMKA